MTNSEVAKIVARHKKVAFCQINYHRNDEVQADIVKITDEELIGDDAVRSIIVVDIDEGTATSSDGWKTCTFAEISG